ncbi:MAG: hypothetical protein K8S56_07785 [Candidatus Cloacimonetes bacterium]|nr:hypothetical protein [Candidatus Cloacimonadota bacterium]
MMNAEQDRQKIREFFDLVEDEHYELRKFSQPVLVFKIENERVFYSLWEESLLRRFGLENVDGWDFDEEAIFAPDWMREEDEFELDDADDSELNEKDMKAINRTLNLIENEKE